MPESGNSRNPEPPTTSTYSHISETGTCCAKGTKGHGEQTAVVVAVSGSITCRDRTDAEGTR